MFIHGGIAWTNSFKICFVFSFFSETAEICDKDTDCFLQNDVMRVVFAGDSISFSIAIERKKKDFEKKRGKVKEKKMMAIIVIVQSTHTYFFLSRNYSTLKVHIQKANYIGTQLLESI